MAESRPGDAATAFREALERWRGPALGGVAGTLDPARGRLEERRLVSFEGRVEADLRLGRHDELIGELRDVVAVHPFREGPRGQLMLALYRAGRAAEALAVFRDARETLADELGLDPGPELRRLEKAILVSDPTLEPPAVGRTGRPGCAAAGPAAAGHRRLHRPRGAGRRGVRGSRPGRRRAGPAADGRRRRADRRAGRDREDVAGRARRPPDAGRVPRRPALRQPARRAGPARPTRRRSWAVSCARSASRRRGSRRARRNAASCTAAGWPGGASWSCWTTPPTRRRSGRCCPASPAARCWSPAAAG